MAQREFDDGADFEIDAGQHASTFGPNSGHRPVHAGPAAQKEYRSTRSRNHTSLVARSHTALRPRRKSGISSRPWAGGKVRGHVLGKPQPLSSTRYVVGGGAPPGRLH